MTSHEANSREYRSHETSFLEHTNKTNTVKLKYNGYNIFITQYKDDAKTTIQLTRN